MFDGGTLGGAIAINLGIQAVAARDGPVAGLLSEQCDASGHRHLVDGGSGRLERPIARRRPQRKPGGDGAVRRRETNRLERSNWEESSQGTHR
jgi:hypothetical protein